MSLRRTALALLLIGALGLAACGGQPDPVATPTLTSTPPLTPSRTPSPQPTWDLSRPAPGGTLRVGIGQEPATLNPLLTSSPTELALAALSLDGLVRVNAAGDYEAVLAESLPTVSADGLVVTYKLKRKITFSNGDLLTCADVQFTYQAIMSNTLATNRAAYQAIKAVECQDKQTALVIFSEMNIAYLDLFPYILPHTAGDVTQLGDWAFNRAPVGSGPWVVDKWQAGEELVYVPNPDYREKDRPYLDSLTFRVWPDLKTGLQWLADSQVDMLWGLTEADLVEWFAAAGQNGDLAAAQTATGASNVLVFNLGNPTINAPDPARYPHPILSDLNVRRAIQMGIDRQLISDFLLYGQAPLGVGILPAGPFACPQPAGSYDPQAARQKLEEAGWKPLADGIRAKAGQRLQMKVQVATGDERLAATAAMLVEMLRAIGMELQVEEQPAETLFAGWAANGSAHHGRFDALLMTAGDALDPARRLYDAYHSSRIPTLANQGEGDNYARYTNAEVDGWLTQAASSFELEQRQGLFCQVAGQVAQDTPAIFLYNHVLVGGYRRYVREFRIAPGPASFAVNAAEWWSERAIPPTQTPIPTQRPTASPTPSLTVTPEGAEPSQAALPVLPILIGVVVTVLIVAVVIFLILRRRRRQQSEEEDQPPDGEWLKKLEDLKRPDADQHDLE